jgi:O-glycosyl hydrolase
MRIAHALLALLTVSFLVGCGGSNGPSTQSQGTSSTSTALTATQNSTSTGTTVTLTATVTVTGSGATAPTGTVTFYDGTTMLGTQTLSAGSGAAAAAAYTTSTLAAASTHSYTATFAGTSGLSTSTSTPVALTVTVAGPASTSTMLTASPNPSTAGATVTLTATVTSSSGMPTGTVNFLDGTTNIGMATLSNGVATFSTSTLAVGAAHNLTASYAGDATFSPSAAAVALVVNPVAPTVPASTTLMLAATPNPAAAGATVALVATITSAAGTPTGIVSFSDGPTSLGTATLVNGVATLSTTAIPAGTNSIMATFAGNSSYVAATSNAVSLVVTGAGTGTTTALSVTPGPVAAGASVTLTATVTSSNTSMVPTGSVSFYDGTTLLNTATLGAASANTATAAYTTTSLAGGATHSLTAVYAANATFAGSTSTAVSLVVNSAFTDNAAFSFTAPNQTIMGFGGAEAFDANYLDNHPNKTQIMTALFDPTQGLGITFLRLQNNYYNFTGSNATTFDPDDPQILSLATTALGTAPTVLLSSWTPPASLKSNNSVNGCTGVTNGNCTSGFGTLNQVNGAYNYPGFAQFWLSSLQAYAKLSTPVVPNYISIQNEPDFPATYVACLFNPSDDKAYQLFQQDSIYASYGKAFNATYTAIHATGALSTTVPQMIGPESFSISNASALLQDVTSPSTELAAVAHHLYDVPSAGGNPMDQISPMTTFDSTFPTQMKFETEYFQSPGFSDAIDIHEAFTVANDNVYLYWALAWPSTLENGISSDQQGLLYIDNPFNSTSTWAFPTGWAYNDAYYALKGYSFYIRPGYIRYNATSSNADEDTSIYQSPDGKTTVIVILNTSTSVTDTVGLNLSNITYTSSAMYRSSFATPITTTGAERFNSIGAYTSQGITMPPESEVTVVLTN